MRRRLIAGAALVGAVSVATAACFVTDSRDGDTVTVVSSCDLTALNSSAGQATVKAYVQAAQGLLTTATATATELQTVCNAIDADLGLAMGSDPVSACQPIIKRAAANPYGVFHISSPNPCAVDPNARASCVAACAAQACTNAACDTSHSSGSCSGVCTGTCSHTGSGACNGSCEGACNNSSNTCAGECNGTCADVDWYGTCSSGCATKFKGTCAGTCTGTCDGSPVNAQFIPDAGTKTDGGSSDGGLDSGADAEADAGAPGSPDAGSPNADAGPVTIPSNADGNCAGTCVGECSSNASGSCTTPCTGTFSAGTCLALCNGDCVAGVESTGCATALSDSGASCDGICTEPLIDGGTCAGTCNGTCTTALQNEACAGGTLNCHQNQECDFACSVSEVLSVTCTAPTNVELEVIADPALLASLTKHGADLETAVSKASALNAVAGTIAQRTLSDFAAIGATGDLVRACVTEGQTAYTSATAQLSILTSADPSVAH